MVNDQINNDKNIMLHLRGTKLARHRDNIKTKGPLTKVPLREIRPPSIWVAVRITTVGGSENEIRPDKGYKHAFRSSFQARMRATGSGFIIQSKMRALSAPGS